MHLCVIDVLTTNHTVKQIQSTERTHVWAQVQWGIKQKQKIQEAEPRSGTWSYPEGFISPMNYSTLLF